MTDAEASKWCTQVTGPAAITLLALTNAFVVGSNRFRPEHAENHWAGLHIELAKIAGQP